MIKIIITVFVLSAMVGTMLFMLINVVQWFLELMHDQKSNVIIERQSVVQLVIHHDITSEVSTLRITCLKCDADECEFALDAYCIDGSCLRADITTAHD